MLKKERQVQILDILEKEVFVKVETLADRLSVSEVTIRRDISELAQNQQLIKVHGGAQRKQHKKVDTDLTFRKQQNVEAKKIIAKKASQKIEAKQRIYLDAGSTCSFLIPYLSEQDVQVYTHGVHHIEDLVQHGIESYLIGGKIKETTRAAVGSLSRRYLEDLSFDLAFVAFNAYHDDFGYSTPDEEEAMMKATVIQQSDKVYFVGDHTKMNLRSNVHFASKEDGILISDQ